MTDYMVKVTGGGAPTVVRQDYEGAVARAEQLARETGRPVQLFQAVERFTATMPPAETIPVVREVL